MKKKQKVKNKIVFSECESACEFMSLSYGRIIFPRKQGEKNNVKVKMLLLLFKCVSFLVDNNNNFHHVVVVVVDDDDDDKFQDQIQRKKNQIRVCVFANRLYTTNK